MNTLNTYLAKIEAETQNSQTVRALVEQFFNGFFTTENWVQRATGLLIGAVQSGKTAHVLGVVARGLDEGIPLTIYLTTDNIELYNQTLSDCQTQLSGNFQVFGEKDTGLQFCQRPKLVVLKKNSRVLSKWLKHLNKAKPEHLLIIDDEADASSLDTKQNDPNDESRIHEMLCALKQQGIRGSLFIQVTATPQANLLLPKEDPLYPIFWAAFRPSNGYLGGRELYENPLSIRVISNTERDDLKTNILPAGLKQSFAYYILVAAYLRGSGQWARMLVHPSQLQAVHNNVHLLLAHERERLLEEIEHSKLKQVYPPTFADVITNVAGPVAWNVDPDQLVQVLNQLRFLVLNTASLTNNDLYDATKTPLKENQVLIGGNILGRGLRVPCMHVVYYTRTAKKPQLDTMWQHSRIFGYDRTYELIRLFLDKRTQQLFSLITESTYKLIEFMQEHPCGSAIIKFPSNAIPTRRNVVRSSLFFTLSGGQHYLTKDIEEKHQDTQRIDEELSVLDATTYTEVSAQKATQLIGLIQHEPVLELIKDSILSDNMPVRIRGFRQKHIKDNYRAILSEQERKLSDGFPNQFVLSFCQLLPTPSRPTVLWALDARMPDNFIYSRTLEEMIDTQGE